MKLAELITKYRIEHNLSQRGFAAICNISAGYISLIEKEINPQTGKKMIPTLGILNKLAAGMGMTLDDLLSVCDDMDVNLSYKPEVKEKQLTLEEVNRLEEFSRLYVQLNDEEQETIIKLMKGLLSNR